MEVSGSFSLVLVNPALEKQFADLGQAPAFFLAICKRATLISFETRNPIRSSLAVISCRDSRAFNHSPANHFSS